MEYRTKAPKKILLTERHKPLASFRRAHDHGGGRGGDSQWASPSQSSRPCCNWKSRRWRQRIYRRSREKTRHHVPQRRAPADARLLRGRDRSGKGIHAYVEDEEFSRKLRDLSKSNDIVDSVGWFVVHPTERKPATAWVREMTRSWI